TEIHAEARTEFPIILPESGRVRNPVRVIGLAGSYLHGVDVAECRAVSTLIERRPCTADEEIAKTRECQRAARREIVVQVDLIAGDLDAHAHRMTAANQREAITENIGIRLTRLVIVGTGSDDE